MVAESSVASEKRPVREHSPRKRRVYDELGSSLGFNSVKRAFSTQSPAQPSQPLSSKLSVPQYKRPALKPILGREEREMEYTDSPETKKVLSCRTTHNPSPRYQQTHSWLLDFM